MDKTTKPKERVTRKERESQLRDDGFRVPHENEAPQLNTMQREQVYEHNKNSIRQILQQVAKSPDATEKWVNKSGLPVGVALDILKSACADETKGEDPFEGRVEEIGNTVSEILTALDEKKHDIVSDLD